MSGAPLRRRWRRPSASSTNVRVPDRVVRRGALRCGTLAAHAHQSAAWPPNASRFAPFDPFREAGAGDLLFTSGLIATFHRATPARCGAFGDARSIVVGDEGAAQNAGNGRSSLCSPATTRRSRRSSVELFELRQIAVHNI